MARTTRSTTAKTKGRSKRSALRDIANEESLTAQKNESMKKRKVAVTNTRGRKNKRQVEDDESDNESIVTAETRYQVENNSVGRKTRQRRAAVRSKPQVYREVSSDEDDGDIVRGPSSHDDDDYSSDNEGNHNPSLTRETLKMRKNEKRDTTKVTGPSIRFSLPSADDSFTEPTRDWRTAGAMDY